MERSPFRDQYVGIREKLIEAMVALDEAKRGFNAMEKQEQEHYGENDGRFLFGPEFDETGLDDDLLALEKRLYIFEEAYDPTKPLPDFDEYINSTAEE